MSNQSPGHISISASSGGALVYASLVSIGGSICFQISRVMSGQHAFTSTGQTEILSDMKKEKENTRDDFIRVEDVNISQAVSP